MISLTVTYPFFVFFESVHPFESLPHVLGYNDFLDNFEILLVVDIGVHDVFGQELGYVFDLRVQLLQVLVFLPLVRIKRSIGRRTVVQRPQKAKVRHIAGVTIVHH